MRYKCNKPNQKLLTSWLPVPNLTRHHRDGSVQLDREDADLLAPLRHPDSAISKRHALITAGEFGYRLSVHRAFHPIVHSDPDQRHQFRFGLNRVQSVLRSDSKRCPVRAGVTENGPEFKLGFLTAWPAGLPSVSFS